MASVAVLNALLLVLDLFEVAGPCVFELDDLIKGLELLILLVVNVLDIVRVVISAILIIDVVDVTRSEPKCEQRQLKCTRSIIIVGPTQVKHVKIEQMVAFMFLI